MSEKEYTVKVPGMERMFHIPGWPVKPFKVKAHSRTEAALKICLGTLHGPEDLEVREVKKRR